MAHAAVAHRTVEVDGITIFYREAGPADASVVLLLPHGYPDRLTGRVSPDLWRLSWAQVGDPERRANLVRLLADEVVRLLRDFLGRVHP